MKRLSLLWLGPYSIISASEVSTVEAGDSEAFGVLLLSC